jgi:hypothetical protein
VAFAQYSFKRSDLVFEDSDRLIQSFLLRRAFSESIEDPIQPLCLRQLPLKSVFDSIELTIEIIPRSKTLVEVAWTKVDQLLYPAAIIGYRRLQSTEEIQRQILRTSTVRGVFSVPPPTTCPDSLRNMPGATASLKRKTQPSKES